MGGDYQYLIIGGGLAADAAVMGIRAVDESGTIALLSEEPYPPYRRPMLSKSLWRGVPLDAIWLPTADAGISIQTGIRAVSLDLNAKCVWDAQGNRWGFEKLLLATGCAPRTLPQAAGEIVYFRTLEDYFTLRKQLEAAERVGIMGGGYIGSELGAALAMNGKRVTMLFPESGICARLFPPAISDWLNAFYRAQGVEVLSGVLVEAVSRTTHWEVRLSNGEVQLFDALVAGLGVLPRDELAKDAGLDAPNGVRVNEYFQTCHPDVYAVGDVALFPYKLLGIETRVEHEDHAIASGFYAGQAMAGAAQPYEYLPMFYSELFDIRYEAVGLIDSQLEMRLEGALPEGTGIIRYYRAGRLVGLLSWRGACSVDELRERLAVSAESGGRP